MPKAAAISSGLLPVGRFGKPLKSKILGNERAIFVYKPPGYSETADPYPLLIFGASYINQIRLPAILDNLIARRRTTSPGLGVRWTQANGTVGWVTEKHHSQEVCSLAHRRQVTSTRPPLNWLS
jgi:hypothetical protein